MKTTLYLSLKKLPFDLMAEGIKAAEYRKPSKWIKSRLSRMYDHVKFTNGYGPDKPWFKAIYRGYYTAEKTETITYSNGLVVSVEPGDYVLLLGTIIERGNIK